MPEVPTDGDLAPRGVLFALSCLVYAFPTGQAALSPCYEAAGRGPERSTQNYRTKHPGTSASDQSRFSAMMRWDSGCDFAIRADANTSSLPGVAVATQPQHEASRARGSASTSGSSFHPLRVLSRCASSGISSLRPRTEDQQMLPTQHIPNFPSEAAGIAAAAASSTANLGRRGAVALPTGVGAAAARASDARTAANLRPQSGCQAATCCATARRWPAWSCCGLCLVVELFALLPCRGGGRRWRCGWVCAGAGCVAAGRLGGGRLWRCWADCVCACAAARAGVRRR